MHTLNKLHVLTLFGLLLLVAAAAHGQTNSSKTYRGSIGDKHIEMDLNVIGGKVTGTYFYDQFKQDIKLEGAYDAKGQLELTEGIGKRKTGKFVCKSEPETSDTDLECDWLRPDGKVQALVMLVEQSVRFKKGTEIVPKITSDRKRNIFVSYPQLTAPLMTDGMKGFNLEIESRVREAIKTFEPETIAHSNFDTNYNVMRADDDIVSVEMVEYSDVGAAHPNTRLWTVNYNLKTNKPLTLDDVFRNGSDFKSAIAEFVVKDINQRADKIEMDEARRNNRQPEKREEPLMTADSLPEMDTWGLSAKGFVAYFDFPHVIAVFDKTTIPYRVLTRYLRPDGVVVFVK